MEGVTFEWAEIRHTGIFLPHGAFHYFAMLLCLSLTCYCSSCLGGSSLPRLAVGKKSVHVCVCVLVRQR